MILLFMPVVKRKKQIFFPKMQKSGTCFCTDAAYEDFYYYNTIFK